MSTAPSNVHDMADDRIHLESTHRPSADMQYPRMGSSSAVVVQPSFDDAVDCSKTPVGPSPVKFAMSQEWQARSPNEDEKEGNAEPRSPSSPPNRDVALSSRHERNLSAHFFDATTLSRDDHPDSEPAMTSTFENYSGRKHRRLFSGDATNPPIAHRRTNSIGNSAVIQRTGPRRPQQHHRVESGGLDILSAAAAVDIPKSEFDGAVAPPSNNYQAQSSHKQHPYPSSSPMGEAQYPGMHPPQPRPSLPAGGPYVPPPPGPYHPSAYPPYPPTAAPYYPPGYPSRPMPPHPVYPTQYAQRPPPTYVKGKPYPPPYRGDDRQVSERSYDKKSASPPHAEWSNGNSAPHHQHQGSQTFVTAISVGNSNRTLNPSNVPKEEVPSHHRKMSSFSSLGSIFPSVFSPGGNDPHPLKKGHHRATSSSVSFLDGFDSTDDTFLRNLQASNAALGGGELDPSTPPPDGGDDSLSGSKLAAGGTSKRVRRKCSVEGCSNRVVQGGLCISHGAKRKTCKHPGCTKNVKKAGLCSTHGPARKRCEADGCQKVAVQGGRCISHGAKKRMCMVTDCTKQAILSGMCKKHHDRASAEDALESARNVACREAKSAGGDASSNKQRHTRGLSIFQEISADAVQSILNDGDDDDDEEVSQTRRGSSNGGGNMW